MSLVTFEERKELADSANAVSEHPERKTPDERCPLWSRGSRIAGHGCRLLSPPSFFHRGDNRVCSVSEFKFYGLKLPVLLGVLFLWLASLSEIFLLPVLLIGLVLNWSIQTYLNASAISLEPHQRMHNKESCH
jgi:hypothetical protein